MSNLLKEFERSLRGSSVQNLESDVVGELFSTPGNGGGDPKKSVEIGHWVIPTVSDRIAQTVVKLVWSRQVEPHFHQTHTATGRASQR